METNLHIFYLMNVWDEVVWDESSSAALSDSVQTQQDGNWASVSQTVTLKVWIYSISPKIVEDCILTNINSFGNQLS